MNTDFCRQLGMEYAIFAFTHCRDVVVAVSKAGGFGVLGAVGFTTEQLKTELEWIDAHIGDKPYGVDTVIPQKYEGIGEMDSEKLQEQLAARIPDEHRKFAADLLSSHGVPELPAGEKMHEMLGWTLATAMPQVEEALRHPNVKLIANALGTPPREVVDLIHEKGRIIGALCGSAKQALSHKNGDLDFVIAQGYEGGGHTGDVASIVLWPEVIDAVAPLPVLAAGGIGCGRQTAAAMAMGSAGVWTGSIWLTVTESSNAPAQKDTYLTAGSRDTVRSRSVTGKPARMLRNEWTEAWDRQDTPDPLPMPMQGMVTTDMMARTHKYADKAETQKVAFNPVGQTVGRMNQIMPAKQVISNLVDEFYDSMDRLEGLTPDE